MGGLCKGCGETRELIEAHVLPKAFYRYMVRDGSQMRHFHLGSFDGRAPQGFYDSSILCAECDNALSPLDDYGAQVLLWGFEDPALCHRDARGRIVGFHAEHVDRERLLRFLVSVLWRAALSRKKLYQDVDLGRYLPDAALASQKLDQPVHAAFDAVIVNWLDDEALNRSQIGVLNCVRHRWPGGGPWMFRLHFGYGMALVKVGQADVIDGLKPISLRHSGHLLTAGILRSRIRAWDDARLLVNAASALRLMNGGRCRSQL